MLRRIRAAMLIAVLWAVTWSVVAGGIGLVQWYRNDLTDVSPISASIAFSLIAGRVALFAFTGALNGLLFAIVLAWAERRQSVATLSFARFALWGGIATLILPIVAAGVFLAVLGPAGGIIDFEAIAEVMGLGMISASVILLIARRGRIDVSTPAA